MEYYGVRGIANQWFSSYLINSKQFVSVGNAIFEQKPITCGVPQGSVLEPLLLLLYVNYFSFSATNLDFHLFADDSNLFHSHKNLQSLEQNLNDQLSMVDKWLCANKLCLNIEKTHFIVFHPAQKEINYSSILKMQEQQIREK